MLKYGIGDDSLAEHGCYICGRADDLVSTDKSIVGEGILAICGGCAYDLATTAGHIVDKRQVLNDLEALLQAQVQVNQELVIERDNALARIEQIGNEWVIAVERAAERKAAEAVAVPS